MGLLALTRLQHTRARSAEGLAARGRPATHHAPSGSGGCRPRGRLHGPHAGHGPAPDPGGPGPPGRPTDPGVAATRAGATALQGGGRGPPHPAPRVARTPLARPGTGPRAERAGACRLGRPLTGWAPDPHPLPPVRSPPLRPDVGAQSVGERSHAAGPTAAAPGGVATAGARSALSVARRPRRLAPGSRQGPRIRPRALLHSLTGLRPTLRDLTLGLGWNAIGDGGLAVLAAALPGHVHLAGVALDLGPRPPR